MRPPQSARPAELEVRELAFRESDGIAVMLLWDPAEDRVLLDVYDARADASFVREVERADALDAFYHPFAYQDRRRREPARRHAPSPS
jgi:hypothetical protein